MEASMSIEIRVPSLGESIVDATIATWLKHEGDPVQQGDALVELETDKINVEANAEQSGVLQQVIKKEGDNVSVGDILGIISEAAQATPSEQRQPGHATDGRQPVDHHLHRQQQMSIDLLQPSLAGLPLSITLIFHKSKAAAPMGASPRTMSSTTWSSRRKKPLRRSQL